MKNYEKLEGMVAATFTPMYENGEINYAEIHNYAKWLADSGVTGVFVCGTTGESQSLTIEERMLILEKWIECSEGRFKVIAHVGSNCQKESVTLAAHAERSGAYAISSIAPCFFKPQSVDDLISFFKPIAAAASGLPFYYYNMPSMSGVNLSVPQFLHEGKKQIPTLVGTKFTHNNLMEMGECIELDGNAFEVLHGYDEILIAGLAFGAKGGVGSTYNYMPGVYRGIFNAMAHCEIEKARLLQKKSIEVVKVIIKYGGGIRGGKAIMNLIGINCGSCRSPIQPFTQQEYNSLNSDLVKINFFAL